MKRLLATLLILVFVYTMAFAEALPVDNTGLEELNADMTFADIIGEEDIQIAGPGRTALYVENYVREHPDIVWEIADYLDVLETVANFTSMYPEAENYNTYELTQSGIRKADLEAGYCVTFHQNLAEDDPFSGYTPAEYSAMIAITLRELNTDCVYIGYFGNPEISFVCMDKETALRFAVRNNQNSIYCVTTEETPVNPKWNGSLNPIRGVE